MLTALMKPDITTPTEVLLLSADAAAASLHIDPRTLANWRTRGGGPRWARVGRKALYRRADLDAWIDAQVYDHTAAERTGHHNQRSHGVGQLDRGAR